MDTSDPEIRFDKDGVCNHCRVFDQAASARILPEPERGRARRRLVRRMKASGRKRAYDCILGVSGGVDSTYAAYLLKQEGLNPLAVHLDNGWNSKMAVENIEKALKKLDVDLYTRVLDWDEFRRIQAAFLRAGVPDVEIPTDHAIFGALFRTASKKNIPWIVIGYNVQTEAVLPRAWSHGHFDAKYIRSVCRANGVEKIRSFPFVDLPRLFYWRIVRRIRVVPFLHYVDYQKEHAMRVLTRELGWQPYAGKHSESVYTKFVQEFVFPRKFGFDKRRAHLSALICSGQLDRAKALRMIEEPFDERALEEDLEYVSKKLKFSVEEFRALMNAAPMSFDDYPSYEKNRVFDWMRKLLTKNVSRKEIRAYLERKGFLSAAGKGA
jgi:N-acetyl sugar amidotransferase